MNINDIIDPDLLATMVAERYVNRQYHPTEPLTVWNYGQRAQFDNVWNDATTMCRGLITNADGGIVARPFRKFFNLNQLAEVPAGEFEAHAKMDGSLGIIYPTSDGPAVATRGSFTSDQAVWATAWLRAHPEHLNAAQRMIDIDVTTLVEIIYPANRIVVDYGDRAELVFLTLIDNDTGEDVAAADFWPGSSAERHSGLDLDGIMAMDAPNTEGFVLRWPCGTRAKVKFAEYLRLHKILTGVNKRTIWELLANGQPLAELLELVPDEFYQWVQSTVAELNRAYEVIESEASRLFLFIPKDVTRAEQAEHIKQTAYPALLFAMLDGKNYASMIWKMLRPEASPPFVQDDAA